MYRKSTSYFLLVLLALTVGEYRTFAADGPLSGSSNDKPAAATEKSTEPLYFSYGSPGFMRNGYSITVTDKDGLKYETPTGGGQGRLSEEQLLKIREACAQFLQDPAPFYFGQPRIAYGSTTYVKARQGQSVRASYVRNEFDPPQVLTLCDSVAQQLHSVTLEKGNQAELDKIPGGFIGSAKSPFFGRSQFRNSVSIPNDDPGKIVTWFSNNLTTLPSGERDSCLEILARLPGIAVGDELYALVHAHPELPVNERTGIIEMSIRSGSLKGFGMFPGLIRQNLGIRDNGFNANVKEIREILDAEAVKKLLGKMDQTELTPESAHAILRWLVSNSTVVKFDVESRRYSFSNADFNLADNTLLIIPASTTANVSDESDPPNYRMMRGLLGWTDDAWAGCILWAGLIFMFARGLFTRSRSSTLAVAILLGLFINGFAGIIIAGGGPGAFVGFFFWPVLYYVAGKAGQLLRKLFWERQRKPV